MVNSRRVVRSADDLGRRRNSALLSSHREERDYIHIFPTRLVLSHHPLSLLLKNQPHAQVAELKCNATTNMFVRGQRVALALHRLPLPALMTARA